jgi:hypothetical protein
MQGVSQTLVFRIVLRQGIEFTGKLVHVFLGDNEGSARQSWRSARGTTRGLYALLLCNRHTKIILVSQSRYKGLFGGSSQGGSSQVRPVTNDIKTPVQAELGFCIRCWNLPMDVQKEIVRAA